MKDEGKNTESLLPILGRAVNRDWIPIPRISLDGHTHLPKRQLPLPDHSNILEYEKGLPLG
jgi:hypothetical protein